MSKEILPPPKIAKKMNKFPGQGFHIESIPHDDYGNICKPEDATTILYSEYDKEGCLVFYQRLCLKR